MKPKKNQRVGFLLLPHFSLVALSGAIDVLHQANEHAGECLYISQLIAADGASVESASGVILQARTIEEIAEELDAVFLVSDLPLPQHGFEPVVVWLKQLAQLHSRQIVIGGLGTGAYLLGRAGLLDGHRATIHWPYAALLAEHFPSTVVSSNVFEIDGERLTCASGYASFDMMLAWVGAEHGEELVAELLDYFGHERQRGKQEHQRVPLAARIGGGQPKLTEAVSLMEANYEEPLPTEEIARLVGVSRRQLERLFKQYLNSLPSRYYLELRLVRARQLLQQTSQSILQIGLSCGFSSGPHFSSAYRNHFGITPREQRTQRLSGRVSSG
jgi:AraC family transcriptional regulator, L-arginine-responsive activator